MSKTSKKNSRMGLGSRSKRKMKRRHLVTMLPVIMLNGHQVALMLMDIKKLRLTVLIIIKMYFGTAVLRFFINNGHLGQ